MKKTILAGLTAGLTLESKRSMMRQAITQDFRDHIMSAPHISRGKNGKSTLKRSNAAAHKRTAKKRNNIRKHK